MAKWMNGRSKTFFQRMETFPLTKGEKHRIGKLRGYGNALCAPVAQGFIEAVMDVLQDR